MLRDIGMERSLNHFRNKRYWYVVLKFQYMQNSGMVSMHLVVSQVTRSGQLP